MSKKQFCPMEREAGDEDRALLKSKKSECLTGIYLRLFPKKNKKKLDSMLLWRYSNVNYLIGVTL